MGKKLEMKKNHLLKVAIDFGSTNTVMAWRMYEKDNNGNPRVSENLNSVNNIIKIPSIMIFADENPGNEAVKEDLFGEEASDAAENANVAPVVCTNFKQHLYVNKPDTPEYQKGVKLCIKFFEHLRSVYRTRIINLFLPQVLSDMEVILYLSTPVRAHFTHHSVMREIALNAGFTADNGITEINNDLDEATCIVRYALDNRSEKMKRLFVKAGTERGSLLLFADAGGSTLDSCIMRLHIKEDGSIKFDPVSKWPEDPDVKYPLGGCQIDEAIRDYLIKEGYADKEYTLNKWEKGDGKFRFRRFKEENNIKVQNIGISVLGKVADVCYRCEYGILPNKFYDISPQKINAKIYEEEICKEYMLQFKSSLKELFENQRKTKEYDVVKPSDIDGIFLTGAGSNLYLIPKILLEDFDEKTPGFVNVRNDKDNLFFADWEDPSVCCALGALTDDSNIDIPNYAKSNYFVSLQIYSHDNAIEQALIKGEIELLPQNKVFEIGNVEHSCSYIAGREIRASAKHQILPIVSEYKDQVNYDDNFEDRLTIQVAIKQVKEDGKIETISKKYTHTTKRIFVDKVSYIIKGLLGIIGYIPAGATALIDAASKKLGYKGQLTEAYCNGVETIFFATRKVTLNLSAKVTLSENNAISIETKMENKYFKTSESAIVIKI